MKNTLDSLLKEVEERSCPPKPHDDCNHSFRFGQGLYVLDLVTRAFNAGKEEEREEIKNSILNAIKDAVEFATDNGRYPIPDNYYLRIEGMKRILSILDSLSDKGGK